MSNTEEKTCLNCHNTKCQAARKELGLTQHENIETINGFTWRHLCAHWTAKEKAGDA